jgi:putative DNA primase/helicase
VSLFTREQYERFWTHEIPRLHHTGRDEMRGPCDVHGGDSPDTLLVHLDTGFAHCFKCHDDGEAWTMIDYARARYGMSADAAHQYVYDITGVTPPGNGDRPWTYPFAKPGFLTRDWEADHLIESIERFEKLDDAQAYALYEYPEIKSCKLRTRDQEGRKHLHWLALTDQGGWSTPRKLERSFLPYRASTLKGAKKIWLFNGEKATDRACAAWGVTGTCLPNGEDKWRNEDLVWFASAEKIFLVTDNDPTGEEHGRYVGGRLAAAGLTTHVVAFPGLPPKGDAWDYIEQGGTYEAALAIALDSPLADPGYKKPRKAGTPEPPPPDEATAALAREGPDLITGYGFTDMDNAHRMLAVAAGDLAHNTRLEEPWLIYNGTVWKNQGEHMVEAYAERTMRLLAAQAKQQGKDKIWKWAQRNLNAGGTRAMIRLARRPANVEIDDYDRQPWLINCPSGVYDAARGEWRGHRREDRLTRVFPYDYNPKLGLPNVFLRSLFEWLGGNADMNDGELERIDRLIAYVRRWLACSATDDTKEKGFGVVHGEKGNNGKTTMIATAQSVLGEYAVTIHASDLTRNAWKNQNNVQANIARTRGARAIFAGEPPAGEKFDQSVIKMLTQSEVPVSAALKGKQPFQFLPTAKIWLETNKIPTFDTEDAAFLKRMHLFHFPREFQIEKSNAERLRERLRLEEPAIFTWIVDGIQEYREIGLARPEEAAEALQEIRDEQARDDGEEPFLEHCFDFGPRLWCRVSVIAELRLKFGQQFGLKPIPANYLSRKLTERSEITRGNDYARNKKEPAWLKGLAPKAGMMTPIVGAVLWGYDATEGARAAGAADDDAARERREQEDDYWRKWPRN